MSARSLGQLAADRDNTPPGEPVSQNPTDVLVAAIPTEALAAYTAVVGVVLAASIGAGYAPFRWSAYGAFIALAVTAPVPVYKHRAAADGNEARAVPIPECLSAGAAAAAWGLVMPGSPLTTCLTGNALIFATTAILVTTVAALSLASQQLETANDKNPRPPGLGSGNTFSKESLSPEDWPGSQTGTAAGSSRQVNDIRHTAPNGQAGISNPAQPTQQSEVTVPPFPGQASP